MKGLLKSTFINSRMEILATILLIGLIVMFDFSSPLPSFVPYSIEYIYIFPESYVFMIIAFTIHIIGTSFFNESADKWNLFVFTSPVPRRQIVFAKYVFAIILITAISLAFIPIIYLVSSVNHSQIIPLAHIIPFYIFMSSILLSVLLPIFFLYTYPKAKKITNYLVCFGIIQLNLFFIFNFSISDIFTAIMNNLYTIIPIISTIMFGLSILISLQIIKHKAI